MSLDLVSRKGDPRYRPLVLPALKHLDYLTINELEASEFSGLEIRLPNGEPHVANIARAASALLDAGVRQRVVIHCPEGAWGVSRTEAGRWVPSWRLPPEEIIGSVGAGDAFCAGLAVWQSRTLAVNRQSAAGSRLRPRQPGRPPTRSTAPKRSLSCRRLYNCRMVRSSRSRYQGDATGERRVMARKGIRFIQITPVLR